MIKDPWQFENQHTGVLLPNEDFAYKLVFGDETLYWSGRLSPNSLVYFRDCHVYCDGYRHVTKPSNLSELSAFIEPVLLTIEQFNKIMRMLNESQSIEVYYSNAEGYGKLLVQGVLDSIVMRDTLPNNKVVAVITIVIPAEFFCGSH